MKRTPLRWLCLGLTIFAAPLAAQARVDQNVVYGMYSGLALLMDVHHPAEPNGYGIIQIWGSGWHAPTAYGARQLKWWGPRQIFLDAGYTVFTINHRAAPRFRYPAAVEDAQRAVRFVRHNAAQYGVDPDQLGGWGHSSGGHLIAMLAVMDGDGDPDDPDPVNQASAKLQVVVALAGFFKFGRVRAEGRAASFLGTLGDTAISREASPITYVTPDDPPMLLIHGDDDQVVPFTQSQVMLAALEAKGVEARLIPIPGGGHGANDRPETARWLNHYLLSEARAHEIEPLIAAYAGLGEGVRLARAGEISEAAAAYRTAQERDARLTITARDWNLLCWRGSLWGRAAEVMEACERAVALAPDHGGFRDSRGLARALTGDVAGAIDDFEAYVARFPTDRLRAQRLDWIAALRSGENPFTAEVLDALREQ